MVLGFDASTSVVGYAFYNGNIVIDAGFIDISKLTSNKDKTLYVISILETNPHIKSVTHINLEASLSGFAGGFTSQQVIILLARFNAIFEYIISETWKLPVNLISVTTARKKAFGKSRVKGIKPKDYVKMELPKIHPEVLKFEKLNKKQEWDKKNSDMYDAVVMSIA